MNCKPPEAATVELPYADEVLCAGWNPVAQAVVEPRPIAEPQPAASGDVESFLARLYLCQQA